MLVLASQSPRRKEILTAAGFTFTVRLPNIAEERHVAEQPEEYVQRLAAEKADAVERLPGELVLSADTVVVLDHHVLEKPRDAGDARRMLRLLSNREHEVITGICLKGKEKRVIDCARTAVRFSRLSEQEIEDYIASGEPVDKAGAYAIQGIASRFIEYVNGCYFNVVGLPIALVYRHMKDLGYSQ